MDPFSLAIVIGLGIALTLGTAGTATGIVGSKKTADLNYDIYQTSRSDANSSVQRRVADLKAAGLNPALAAGQGAETVQPVQLQSAEEGIGAGLSKLGDQIGQGVSGTVGQLAQLKQAKATIDNTNANTAYLQSMQGVNEAKIREMEQEYGHRELWNPLLRQKAEAEISNLNSSTGFYEARKSKLIAETAWQNMREAYFRLYNTDIPQSMPVGEVTRKIIEGNLKLGGSSGDGKGSFLGRIFADLGFGGSLSSESHLGSNSNSDALARAIDGIESNINHVEDRKEVPVSNSARNSWNTGR